MRAQDKAAQECGAATWLMNATVYHCTVYSKVMNALVVQSSTSAEKTLLMSSWHVNQWVLPWQPHITAYLFNRERDKLTDSSSWDDLRIAAIKLSEMLLLANEC